MTTQQARRLLPQTVVRDTETNLLGTLTWGGYPYGNAQRGIPASCEFEWRIEWENGATEYRPISKFCEVTTA